MSWTIKMKPKNIPWFRNVHFSSNFHFITDFSYEVKTSGENFTLTTLSNDTLSGMHFSYKNGMKIPDSHNWSI